MSDYIMWFAQGFFVMLGIVVAIVIGFFAFSVISSLFNRKDDFETIEETMERLKKEEEEEKAFQQKLNDQLASYGEMKDLRDEEK